MKSAKEYRLESKKALSGNWGSAIGIVIVFTVISAAIAYVPIAPIILGGAFLIGLSIAFLGLYRNGKLNFGDLFSGFKAPYNFGSTIGMYLKTAIFVFLWSLLFLIPGIIAAFSYSMAPYILADNPNMTGGEAIKASKALMYGKKGKLFCLYFSFIGWWILCALTFGILSLWIVPWVKAAEAAFYESIKNDT